MIEFIQCDVNSVRMCFPVFCARPHTHTHTHTHTYIRLPPCRAMRTLTLMNSWFAVVVGP